MSATSARVSNDALSVPMSRAGNQGWYGVAGVRDAGGDGLARDVRAHDLLEDAAVQRAETPDVGDVEHRLGCGARASTVDEPKLDAELLQEQVAEPEGSPSPTASRRRPPERSSHFHVVPGKVGLRVERENESRVGRPRRPERTVAARVEAL